MKHFSPFKTIIALSLFVFPSSFLLAQCNTFVKKKCMPKIQPFIDNGQMNTSTLSAGQTSKMSLTFFSGQAYRILVCSEKVLGTVSFKILDKTKKIVFDSKENDDPDFWDFKVKSTQEFTLELTVPPSESTSSATPSGCVSVMVGFKKD